MPLKIDPDQLLTGIECNKWLTSSGIPPSEVTEIGDYIVWLTSDATVTLSYKASEQQKFMQDAKIWKDVPAESSDNAHMIAAEKDYLRSVLGGISTDRLTVEFLENSEPRPLDTTHLVRMTQDEIGMSKNGRTNMLTDGFLDCLCMVIVPVNPQKGAVLCHTKQIGGDELKDYASTYALLDEVLQRAASQWPSFDVVFLMGRSPTLTVPDLSKAITKEKYPKIQAIHDLRHFRYLMDQITVDTDHKQIYLGQFVYDWTECPSAVKDMEDKIAGRPKTFEKDGKTWTWKRIKDVPWTMGERLTVPTSDWGWGWYNYD